MKTIRFAKGRDQWVVKYDEEKQTVSVEGSGPTGKEIHRWLTTPKRVIDKETGQLISVLPTQSWDYMKQIIEVDLYNDLGIAVLWEEVDEQE